MKDVTNNFLETIEPVYMPGAINFDFDKFDAAIQAAVSELSDEQLDQLEYDDIKKEFTRFNSLLTKLDNKRKDISKVYKTRLMSLKLISKSLKDHLKDLSTSYVQNETRLTNTKDCYELTTLDQCLKKSANLRD